MSFSASSHVTRLLWHWCSCTGWQCATISC